MKWVFYLAFSLFSIFYSTIVIAKQEIPVSDNETDSVRLSVNQFAIVGDVQPFNTELRIDTLSEGLYIVNLTLYTDFPSALPPFEFDIKFPKKFIDGLWSSRSWTSNSFLNIPNYSRLQSDYSVICAFRNNDKNSMTLATYDNYKSRYTGVDIKTKPDSVIFAFNFFKTSVPDAELLEYKAQILLNLQKNHYSKVIRESVQWRLDHEDNSTISSIDVSLLPVYSLWYPLDRNIPLENITHYFDSISSMGFRSVLFDDGWQNVVRFDVDSTGSWDPSQTAVVKDFMNTVHEKKMKVDLWYTNPFVGANKYVYDRFDGKYLQYITSSQPILDIRYPDVREYLSKMYSEIVKYWGIDGIWFNFLNGYYPDEHIIITDDNGRDYVSVRKSLDSLRRQMEEQMLEVNPDLSVIQTYPVVGPLHTSNTKTINGFLGTTVLTDVREKLVNNRLMYGNKSPFMEVTGIHPKDPIVDLALKFQSVLFGSPYLSYFSYTLPDNLRETLNFWIQYWKTNSQYLLDGEFEAYDPIHRYTILKAGDETKQIIGFYARTDPFDLGYFDFEMADLINSSGYPYLSVKGTPTGKVDYIIYDCSGRYTDRGSLRFRRGVATIEVPVGGFARLIVK